MQKTICVFLAFGMTFGLWASGCRRGDQSATPPPRPSLNEEVVPVPALIYPEETIDWEQPLFTRVREILDRESAAVSLDGPRGPGLFILPTPGEFGSPAKGPMLAAIQPVPGALLPTAPSPEPEIPHFAENIAAMAPPDMTANLSKTVFIPPDSPLLSPDTIPGLFFGAEEYISALEDILFPAGKSAISPASAAEVEILPLPGTEEQPFLSASGDFSLPDRITKNGEIPLPLAGGAGTIGGGAESAAIIDGGEIPVIPLLPFPVLEPSPLLPDAAETQDLSTAAKSPAAAAAVEVSPAAETRAWRRPSPPFAGRTSRRTIDAYEPEVPPIMDLNLP